MEKLYVTSMHKQKGLRTISMTYCSGTRKTRKIRSPRSLGSHNSEGLRRRTAAAVVQVLDVRFSRSHTLLREPSMHAHAYSRLITNQAQEGVAPRGYEVPGSTEYPMSNSALRTRVHNRL